MDSQDLEIKKILKEFSAKLPKFSYGGIDYSNSDKAPVLVCFVKFQDKILLLKRSNKVTNYEGKWNAVVGFIDEPKLLRPKALEELKEELGISPQNILNIKLSESYELFDPEIKKSWIIFPVLATLKDDPKIKLNREHTEYKRINPNEISQYDMVFKLDETLKKVLR